MSSFSRPRVPGKALAGIAVLGLTSLLAGCANGIENGALPSSPEITDHTGTIITLWNGSWIAALAVGVVVWALILWAVVVYRKRKGDNKLPIQTRANIPLELMYTIVPLLMVGVLFKFTVEDISTVKDTNGPVDVHINVVGKQWSWDFNYVDDDVYDPGVQAALTGEEGVEETLPTLYLPVGERVEFTLESRDVIHSFWIPAFLYKMDVVPGLTNTFHVMPQQEGMYQGKCAELCGEYHASMLFNVAVVPRDEYDAHMDALRAEGYTGQIGADEYSRDQVVQITEEHEEAES